jgi:hypothetical protein
MKRIEKLTKVAAFLLVFAILFTLSACVKSKPYKFGELILQFNHSKDIMPFRIETGKNIPFIVDSLNDGIIYATLEANLLKGALIPQREIALFYFNFVTDKKREIYQVRGAKDKEIVWLISSLPKFYGSGENPLIFIAEDTGDIKSRKISYIERDKKQFIGSLILPAVNIPFANYYFTKLVDDEYKKGNFIYFLTIQNRDSTKVAVYNISTKELKYIDIDPSLVINNSSGIGEQIEIFETENFLIFKFKFNDQIRLLNKADFRIIGEMNGKEMYIIGGSYNNDILIFDDRRNEKIKIIKINEKAIDIEKPLNFIFRKAFCNLTKNDSLNVILFPPNFLDGLDTDFLKVTINLKSSKTLVNTVKTEKKYEYKAIRFLSEKERIFAVLVDYEEKSLSLVSFGFSPTSATINRLKYYIQDSVRNISFPLNMPNDFIVWNEVSESSNIIAGVNLR